MASTIVKANAPRRQRRPRDSPGVTVGRREIDLANELTRCLEALDRGTSFRAVERSLRSDVSDEITPLLRVARLLRREGRALQMSACAQGSAD